MMRLVLHVNDQRIPITDDEFVIGRGCSGEDLALSSYMISRGHASIRQTGDHHTIQDNGSTNGTFYNGERIIQQKIKDGDAFLLGDVVLRFFYQTDQTEP